jgi:hypothetical protein
MKFSYAAVLATAFAASTGAFAASTTYTNGDFGLGVRPFGAPDTTVYGEVITLAAGQTLTDFSFYLTQGGAGNYTFDVAAWNGSRATGTNLYSAPGSYAGGAQALSFSGIDTTLAAGQYVIYVTTSGEASPVTNGVMELGNGRGGIGAGFVYLNSYGIDPLVDGSAWSPLLEPYDAQYSATFSSTVPEPASVALMLAGFGLVSVAAHRRQRNS